MEYDVSALRCSGVSAFAQRQQRPRVAYRVILLSASRLIAMLESADDFCEGRMSYNACSGTDSDSLRNTPFQRPFIHTLPSSSPRHSTSRERTAGRKRRSQTSFHCRFFSRGSSALSKKSRERTGSSCTNALAGIGRPPAAARQSQSTSERGRWGGGRKM